MNYHDALELIYSKAPFQKKKIQAFLEGKTEEFYQQADNFVSEYEHYLITNGLTFEFAVEAYLAMCRDMLLCQVSFMRTGKYPTESQKQAFFEVYDSKEVMFGYMVGLGFSQFLWSSHYEMYEHFKSTISSAKEDISNYLEVGPGHGLFLKFADKTLDDRANIRVVDISETSIEMTRSLLSLGTERKQRNISYIVQNFLDFESASKFDFVVMGEVLEHVEFPEDMLLKIVDLLDDNGRAFISTCINCPMTDHVYHFQTVEEIRELFNKVGLTVATERILPVEDLPFEEIMQRKITVNYSAVVRKLVNNNEIL